MQKILILNFFTTVNVPASRLLSLVKYHASYIMSPVPRILSHVFCLMSPVLRLQSHVSYLTSPVSRVLSVSHVTSSAYSFLPAPPVPIILPAVSCLPSPVLCLMLCLMSHVSCDCLTDSFSLLKFRFIVFYTTYMYRVYLIVPTSGILLKLCAKFWFGMAQIWHELAPLVSRHCHRAIFLLSRHRDVRHLFFSSRQWR